MEVVELEKLRTPITVNAVYILLLGLITLSPGMVSSVFGYAVGDAGVLRVLSGTLLGLGVLLWGIASNVSKYGSRDARGDRDGHRYAVVAVGMGRTPVYASQRWSSDHH